MSATGFASYRDARPGGGDATPKAYVEFQVAGSARTLFGIVDTAAPYCILNPEAAKPLRPHLADPFDQDRVSSRLGAHDGDLFRHTITLVAQQGAALDVEATLWICPEWPGPCFLGYLGVFDRIRFALDPGANRFYFGPLA